MTTSSILFRNSGEKVRFRALSITFTMVFSGCLFGAGTEAHALTEIFQLTGTNVGGHDDECVLEVNLASEPVCKLTIIKNLQQNIENVRVSFSISSSSTTLYGLRLTFSVSCPPSSYPT